MNSSNTTFADLCCLFCCPPCPSKVVSKLAFLPPTVSYQFQKLESSTTSSEYKLIANDIQGEDNRPLEFDNDQVQPFFVKTKRGNKIACTYIKYTSDKMLYERSKPKFVILFSHGNAVDIGQMPPFYLTLASRLKCDIFSYDYSGYGLSTGTANEANLYADIRAAYKFLKDKLSFTDDKIILYGQSIGTVPTIDLSASETGKDIKAVILHSPLLSGIRVVMPNAKTSQCFDPFPSIDKVGKIQSSVLVIHGTDDEVIDFNHGLQIYDLANKALDPLWVEGAGHNDIEYFPVYIQRLMKLVQELETERSG